MNEPRMTLTEAVQELGAGKVFAPNGQYEECPKRIIAELNLSHGYVSLNLEAPFWEDEDDGPLNCGYHRGHCGATHLNRTPLRCEFHSDRDAVKPGSTWTEYPLCVECLSQHRQGML